MLYRNGSLCIYWFDSGVNQVSTVAHWFSLERTQIGCSYYTTARADLGATSTYMIQASKLGDVEEKKNQTVKLPIKNRQILYFLALAKKQRCRGTAELRDAIFVWVKVQSHSWKQAASKFSMLYLLFFKLPRHHFSPIRLWHPSYPQRKELSYLIASAGGGEGEPDIITECPPRQRALISLSFEIFN